MANLIAITYSDPKTAEEAMKRVDWAAFDHQVKVLDACWMTNEGGKVVVHPKGHPVAGKAAMLGGVGLVIGALFALPVAGLAVGAALGAHRGKKEPTRFDDAFVESIKTKVAEGGSALVVLYDEGADTERAGAELAQLGGTVWSSTIADADLARIQQQLNQSDAE